jgi:hypothetical protein
MDMGDCLGVPWGTRPCGAIPHLPTGLSRLNGLQSACAMAFSAKTDDGPVAMIDLAECQGDRSCAEFPILDGLAHLPLERDSLRQPTPTLHTRDPMARRTRIDPCA